MNEFIIHKALCFLMLITLLSACEQDHRPNDILRPTTTSGPVYETKNVVIIVIDGPRFSETWGDNRKEHIPYMAANLAPLGVTYNSFYNNGPTYTTSGHTAITTGNYQIMQNDGSEFPHHPSIFQLWLNQTKESPKKAYIIASKKKLEVLADCSDIDWRSKFNPSVNTDDRDDSITFRISLSVFQQYQPRLVLIHFRGPDKYGHENNWKRYLESIKETDKYVNDLWEFLQLNNHYRNKTTLFVTNDHGRHLDSVKDGFISHGDYCIGCLHINFFAIGPDFKPGTIINKEREVIDLFPTVAQLMGFGFPYPTGDVLSELFINPE